MLTFDFEVIKTSFGFSKKLQTRRNWPEFAKLQIILLVITTDLIKYTIKFFTNIPKLTKHVLSKY